MKSFPDPSFYIKNENFETSLNSLVHNTQNISPAILQQMQQLQGGAPMPMPELSIIKHDSPKMDYPKSDFPKSDSREVPSSNGSSLQIIPKQNLQNMHLSSNLASCRLEAKNNVDIHEQINMLKNIDLWSYKNCPVDVPPKGHFMLNSPQNRTFYVFSQLRGFN